MGKKSISNQAVNFILTLENKDLRDLNAEEVAKRIGVKTTNLSRNFKIDQKISLTDFIIREKIYRAIFLLEKNHDLSIEELSNELGFRDVNDFEMTFRSIIAIEPEKYRGLRKTATNQEKGCLQL